MDSWPLGQWVTTSTPLTAEIQMYNGVKVSPFLMTHHMQGFTQWFYVGLSLLAHVTLVYSSLKDNLNRYDQEIS